jgi:hypothetical protein
MLRLGLSRAVITLVLFGSIFFFHNNAYAQKSPLKFTIETFDTLNVGSIPMTWRNRDGDKQMTDESPEDFANYHYRVEEEDGNKFLRFDGIRGKHLNYPLADKDISLNELPFLNWKWRAIDLPEGADESVERTNDAVLSVYVVFKILRFTRIPKVIRYTWSSTLEKEMVVSNNLGKQKIVVLETGTDKLNQWISVKRNLVEDYQNFFGGDPPEHPVAFLILSDGNNVNDRVIGDYDDIFLSKN